jgi:hypothetical protein
MNLIKLDKCVMTHLDLDVSGNNLLNQITPIHEHDLVLTAVKDANNLLIRCITCRIHYCNLCGKTFQKGTS